jgi:hypothetical protein
MQALVLWPRLHACGLHTNADVVYDRQFIGSHDGWWKNLN